MYKRIYLTSYLVFIVFLLGSCTHFYYGPNSNNIPLLQKKGDGRAMAAIASSDETTGFEFQTAYAFSSHVGSMINLYTAAGNRETSLSSRSRVEKGSGTIGEIGVGYFTMVKGAENWIFETYAGAGSGSVNNEYGNAEKSKVNLSRVFIQPSIAYSNGWGDLAFSSRFSHVNFTVKQADVRSNTRQQSELLYIANNRNHLFWEPSILLRFGFRNAKVQFQVTRSLAFTTKSFSAQQYVVSTGIFFSFSRKPKTE